MLSMRRSPTKEPNPHLREEMPEPRGGNRGWLARNGDADGIILLGGTSVADFRVRVAQSALRHDMFPSHWSRCGILLEGGKFISAPFEFADVSAIPKCNGVRTCPLDDYDDPQRFPNVAVIRFAEAHRNVHRDITRVQGDRSIIDLPFLMLPWLGFLWGVSGSTNPLPTGIGLPSAAFVETVFAMAGFELTPGLSSASSCPEAIWQSAKWWTDYYEGAVTGARALAGGEVTQSTADLDGAPAGDKEEAPAAEEKEPLAALPMIPTGFFTIRQKAAAVMEPSGD